MVSNLERLVLTLDLGFMIRHLQRDVLVRAYLDVVNQDDATGECAVGDQPQDAISHCPRPNLVSPWGTLSIRCTSIMSSLLTIRVRVGGCAPVPAARMHRLAGRKTCVVASPSVTVATQVATKSHSCMVVSVILTTLSTGVETRTV